MPIRMEVWGEYALFLRPEKATKWISYEIPTPIAARGIIESVYFHPGLRWTVDKIYILNPISFENVRIGDRLQNRIAEAGFDESQISRVLSGKKRVIPPEVLERTRQETAVMLKNVHYVIEAHFNMTDKANLSDNPGKFQSIIQRRLKKGVCYTRPYLGVQECAAQFRLWEQESIPTISQSSDLGWMLYDMDYSNPEDITPVFFHAQMVDGVINLHNCGIVR